MSPKGTSLTTWPASPFAQVACDVAEDQGPGAPVNISDLSTVFIGWILLGTRSRSKGCLKYQPSNEWAGIKGISTNLVYHCAAFMKHVWLLRPP